jgi:hypothetical protein
MKTALPSFHAKNPDRARAAPFHAFFAALQRMTSDDGIAFDGAFVRLSSHRAHLSAAEEVLSTRIAPLMSAKSASDRHASAKSRRRSIMMKAPSDGCSSLPDAQGKPMKSRTTISFARNGQRNACDCRRRQLPP